MTAKTSAERMRDLEKRRTDMGWVWVKVMAPPAHREAIRAFAKKLQKRGKNGSGGARTPSNEL